MNKQMFVDKANEIEIPKLMIQAIITEDDIGAVLRIHLLCEQLAEAWICAACDADNFFGEGDYSVRINCSDKFKLARNLGLPASIYSCLRIINKIRNDVAHKHNFDLIPQSSIDSLINLLKDFRAGDSPDSLTINASLVYRKADGSSSEEHSVHNENTPNRIKLYICFSLIMHWLIFSIGNDDESHNNE